MVDTIILNQTLFLRLRVLPLNHSLFAFFGYMRAWVVARRTGSEFGSMHPFSPNLILLNLYTHYNPATLGR